MEQNIETHHRHHRHRVVVQNHLVLAIIITVFCCIPFGIVAIIYSCKTDTALASGDIGLAIHYSDTSKKWSIAGVILGLLSIIVGTALQFAIYASQGIAY